MSKQLVKRQELQPVDESHPPLSDSLKKLNDITQNIDQVDF